MSITLFGAGYSGGTSVPGEGIFAQGITLPDEAGDNTKGIQFGADTNLYRSGANTLRSDDAFQTSQGIFSRVGGAGQLWLDDSGGQGMIRFGSAADTNLYRSAANELKTDDKMSVQGGVRLLTNDGTVSGGLEFWDVNFWRSGVGILETNGQLKATGQISGSGNIFAQVGGASQVAVGAGGGLQFGSALDVNLYRAAADKLATDDDFLITGPTKWLKMQRNAGAAEMSVLGFNNTNALNIGSGSNDFVFRSSGGATASVISVSANNSFIIGVNATDSMGFFGKAAVARPAGIADPAGGAVIDVQARAAVVSVITALESLGLIATV